MVSAKLIVFHHRYVGKDHAGQDNTKCKQYEARDALCFLAMPRRLVWMVCGKLKGMRKKINPQK